MLEIQRWREVPHLLLTASKHCTLPGRNVGISQVPSCALSLTVTVLWLWTSVNDSLKWAKKHCVGGLFKRIEVNLFIPKISLSCSGEEVWLFLLVRFDEVKESPGYKAALRSLSQFIKNKIHMGHQNLLKFYCVFLFALSPRCRELTHS